MHAFDNTLNVFPMFLGWLAGVKVRISESISKGDKNEKKTIVKLALRPFSHWFTNYYMANSIDCGVWQFGKKTYDKGKITIFKTVINADANAFDKVLRDETRKKFGWAHFPSLFHTASALSAPSGLGIREYHDLKWQRSCH